MRDSSPISQERESARPKQPTDPLVERNGSTPAKPAPTLIECIHNGQFLWLTIAAAMALARRAHFFWNMVTDDFFCHAQGHTGSIKPRRQLQQTTFNLVRGIYHTPDGLTIIELAQIEGKEFWIGDNAFRRRAGRFYRILRLPKSLRPFLARRITRNRCANLPAYCLELTWNHLVITGAYTGERTIDWQRFNIRSGTPR